jgi:PAS domain S-box-containing protein
MTTEGRSVRGRMLEMRWIVAFIILGSVAGVFLTGHVASPAHQNTAFLPASLAVVDCAYALTTLMLMQKFLAGGRGKLLGVASAYLFASLIAIPQVLAMPGLVTPHGPLAFTPSTSAWLWVAWHSGFPLLLGTAVATGGYSERWTVTPKHRRSALAVVCIGTLTLVAAVTLFIIAAGDALPALSSGGTFDRLVHVAGVWMIPLNLTAVCITVACCWNSEGTMSWVPVAAVSSFSEVTLAMFSHTRYTWGWYGGRLLAFCSANIVLAALLLEFARLYRESEEHRRVLEDEALNLLRENRAALYREDRVRRVIENAADAYIEINSKGVIQAWNGKATELFGWTNDSAQGKPFVETVMAEEGWNEFRELIEEFWSSEERFDGSYAELLVMSGDGREFPVEATLWVDESDFEPRMSFFLRDITVRRETQEKLREALEEEREAVSRLQEIDRVKSTFVSTVSHELRSPLTNTLGYLELLADGDVGALTESQLHMVTVAQRNAQRLFSLIEDLLILSRVEEGAFSVRFRAVPVQDVLQAVESGNSAVASERNVTLRLDIDENVGVCPGDAKQLTRALSNVVNNAVKFSDDGGTVEITARQTAGEIEFVVKDNGIGIPNEEQSKLFERFFRTSISVEAQHPGAGLGLTIAKAIIDHHGGSIDIDSQLGKGTTVTIRLPAMHTLETAVAEVVEL